MEEFGTFGTTTSRTGGASVVALHGELDIGSVAELRDAVADLPADALVLDLRELAFMDSSGLAALLTLSRAAEDRGGRLRVVRAPPGVQRLFTLTRTDTLFDWIDAPG